MLRCHRTSTQSPFNGRYHNDERFTSACTLLRLATRRLHARNAASSAFPPAIMVNGGLRGQSHEISTVAQAVGRGMDALLGGRSGSKGHWRACLDPPCIDVPHILRSSGPRPQSTDLSRHYHDARIIRYSHFCLPAWQSLSRHQMFARMPVRENSFGSGGNSSHRSLERTTLEVKMLGEPHSTNVFTPKKFASFVLRFALSIVDWFTPSPRSSRFSANQVARGESKDTASCFQSPRA